jgi:hypothetical protein
MLCWAQELLIAKPWIDDAAGSKLDVVSLSAAIDACRDEPLKDLLRRLRRVLTRKTPEEQAQVGCSWKACIHWCLC